MLRARWVRAPHLALAVAEERQRSCEVAPHHRHARLEEQRGLAIARRCLGNARFALRRIRVVSRESDLAEEEMRGRFGTERHLRVARGRREALLLEPGVSRRQREARCERWRDRDSLLLDLRRARDVAARLVRGAELIAQVAPAGIRIE